MPKQTAGRLQEKPPAAMPQRRVLAVMRAQSDTMIPNIGPSTAPKMETKIVIAYALETNSHGHTRTDRIEAISPPMRKLNRLGLRLAMS
jgi:hypothetical protein